MTTGGIFAIHQIAVELARTIDVNLVVVGYDPIPVKRIKTFRSELLSPREIPDADAIVLYCDAIFGKQFADLPASKGRKFIYFQGYGEIGNPVVTENLRRGFGVIASARWLVDEARAQTNSVFFVPYGLDKSIFNPRGRTQPARVVAMMTHVLQWKGIEDGLEAMRRVRAALGDVRLILFGIANPGFEGAEFIERPSRPKIADIMRKSDVFVCPSWEEGFGMPGLEAMACGAALATTDTKGCRDYALHAHTALVSPPKNPDALARNIIALLIDDALRGRIAAAGQQTAFNYPTWPQAAHLFLHAIDSSQPA